MDENKLKVLNEIGYQIRECCLGCEHGVFYGIGFGECTRHKYMHLKHQNPKGGRDLSVHASGWCPEFSSSGTLHDSWLQFKEWD